ncbi:N-acetylmuramoyl-L-alanine amidase [Propionimicrobium sp. PCR01-08-3]|uniref:peptidoglycan recognition protein family protein n=1 Tax=Propionimicrobium sp. PCR01-08-3 TaxID=3052086 RepID=UPI00255CDCB8|nr:N-acetylmuramoyl-L-alanine amidase [Propionimicrobium sp. PCR01-08-3]WIY84343.1 N-acetylmuramoyl-L-alanine amidase [Propionimicrobium sp. PCR01-08-3]
MDWLNLEPDEYKLLNVHYSPGREGHAIDKVVIHHNGGSLSIQQIWDVWQTREASAHYQVDVNGRIGQLVNDSDTAWHAGDWGTNLTSIGIEHANLPGSMAISDATYEAGTHLTAAICRHYGLGLPTWGQNLFPHRNFTSTSCPGEIWTKWRDWYQERARWYYNNLSADTGSAPAVAAPASGGAVSFPAYPFDPNGWDRLGDIEGPDQVHGGDARYDGDNVRAAIQAVQRWLIIHGYAEVDHDDGWADGIFEQPTIDAVKRFQADCMPGTTYPGEVWADDYAYMASHNN